MRRVVVTGMGIVSCLGNDIPSVVKSLGEGRSGIRAQDTYRELGLRSQVAGLIALDPADRIDRRQLRFMGDSAAYAYLAMAEAVADAELSAEEISDPRVGLIVGSGGSSMSNTVDAVDTLRSKGFPVYVSPGTNPGDSRWRVRVGPLGTRAEAEATAERLKKNEKLPTWILSEDAS